MPKKGVKTQNQAVAERVKARSEAAKTGKKSKAFSQPKAEDVKAAVKAHIAELRKQARSEKKATIAQLKGQVLQRHPKTKGLADATREELEAVLSGEANFDELLGIWAKRAKARRDAWLKGDSESAKAARVKKGK